MKLPNWVQIRTGALFGAGLLGVGYETIVSEGDRPTLLILFAAMMGLPLFLKADEKTLQKFRASHVVENGSADVESSKD